MATPSHLPSNETDTGIAHLKAAWFESFGTARRVLRVGDRPKPSPGEGEVLIELATSAVNPSDVKKRAGSMPELLDEGYVIPHSDGAGIIVEVGEGVDDSRTGERVWVYQAQHARRLGSAAQFTAIDQRRAVPLPCDTSFVEGACLGIPAMTAHRCVFADGPVEGQSVLITGGAGRVGHYAVQWARRGGARVITTASRPEDVEICLAAGAHAVVNHRLEGWWESVLDHNGGRKLDRIIEVDFAANLGASLEMIKVGGTIATYASMSDPQPCLPFYRMMFMDLTLRMVIVYDMPEAAKQQAIPDITAALESGTLRHLIAQELPLGDIVRAHELIEGGGVRGCVVLDTEA